MRKIACALAVGGLLGTLITAASAGAAPAQPAAQAPAVGVVDLSRLNKEYRGIQQLDGEFKDFYNQQKAKLDERMKTHLLDDNEQREYLDLSTVGAPTETNKKRMAELASLSDEREQALSDLAKKQARTPDEQTRYDMLSKIASARSDEFDKLQNDLNQLIADKQAELMKVIDDSVNAAIRIVAEQKKLSVVFAKEVVRFGGVDITDDVIAKLNSMPLPKAPETTPAPAAGAPAPATATPAPAVPAPKTATPAPATTNPPAGTKPSTK